MSALVRAPGIGEGLREAIEAEAARATGHEGPRLAVATVPVDALDPIALYTAAREEGHEGAIIHSPGERFALVGIGRAAAIEAAGPERFRQAEAAWRSLLARASVAGAFALDREAPRGVGPVLLGGLGFSGEVPDRGSAWGPFGAASLVLPSLTLAMSPEGAWLSAALEVTAGAAAAGRLERQWERLAAATRACLPTAATAGAAGLTVVAQQPDEPTWARLVALFAGAVGRGRLDKVVLARQVDLVAPVALDVPTALRRLAASAPESTLYAFGRADRTFLGATPERLVRTDGREFRTVAVAGTAGRGTDPLEDAGLAAGLLVSEKDLEEHAVVVDAIRAALEPVTERLSVADGPAILPLRHVQHLVTPIEGSLHERAGLLAIAGRLHPTPAVGGEPRELALSLIDEHEGFDRGWYAGPIGWLGADGDGELWVALRCGLVDGARATLFTGCGIVADSDPGREWQESRIKLRAVAAALGRPQDEP